MEPGPTGRGGGLRRGRRDADLARLPNLCCASSLTDCLVEGMACPRRILVGIDSAVAVRRTGLGFSSCTCTSCRRARAGVLDLSLLLLAILRTSLGWTPDSCASLWVMSRLAQVARALSRSAVAAQPCLEQLVVRHDQLDDVTLERAWISMSVMPTPMSTDVRRQAPAAALRCRGG
jgi:hypothetical protein